ncbi:hypothetical protein [Cobetia sp. UCD-24C]|uniref:hypothetical protein n=1 Tax=Cobetia sp. UCD-24C TaxID=1716176 RepID=UPI001F318E9D|nr:hypothetical protein [Cobetia sp. UCD-24C]
MAVSKFQWITTVMSKMMGQVNLVRIGQHYIAEGGSFTLISGILNVKPIPMAIADATTSGAIDTVVKCVAYELPRGVRINAINLTVLEEAWEAYGELMLCVIPLKQILRGPACARTLGETQFVAERGMMPKSFESAAISLPSLCSNRSTLTWQVTSQTPLSAST